ncbi:MAG: LysR family transcriptional regulator [Syntrophaceae bacterium]|nr:LysR family transcriptional regulator [Syntrophaceae bacterium]
MEIRAKFWIENRGEVVLGRGKTDLLLAVDRLGSIQAAAEQFGMSYRHAWGAIRKIEQRAGFKILDTKLGRIGGGAQLTPEGKEFIGRVDSLLRDLQTIVEERFNHRLQELLLRYPLLGGAGTDMTRQDFDSPGSPLGCTVRGLKSRE